MISVADAYRLGPDGQVDMDLFRQFADQQAALQQNANNSLSLTQGQQYLAANPDVLANAQMRAQEAGLSSGPQYSNYLDQVAREHYDAFGQTEGRGGFGNPAGQPRTYTGTPGTNINPGTGETFTPAPGQQPSMGAMPGSGMGQSQQPTFDSSSYQTALDNFGGLLNNYGSFFGGILSGAQNAMTNPNLNPYSGYPNANYVTPFFNASPNFGSGSTGGWNSGSSWSGGSAANTGHNMLWTT